MAETASVTEAQGFSNIGTRYLLHHVCDLLAWAEAGECLEGKGIRTSFFPQKTNDRVVSPIGSEQRLRVDSVGIKRRGWVPHMPVYIPPTQFRCFIDKVWGTGTKWCVFNRLSPLFDTISNENGDHSRQDRSGLTGGKWATGLCSYTGQHTSLTHLCQQHTQPRTHTLWLSSSFKLQTGWCSVEKRSCKAPWPPFCIFLNTVTPRKPSSPICALEYNLCNLSSPIHNILSR